MHTSPDEYVLSLDSGGKISFRTPDGSQESKDAELNEEVNDLLHEFLAQLDANTMKAASYPKLGKWLFKILIGDKLKSPFHALNTNVNNKPSQMWLRLDLDKDFTLNGLRFAALPWEFLYHEQFGFLATHDNVTLSRYTSLNAPTERQLDNLPLRVLFVGAKPKDLGLVFADPAKEAVAEQLQDRISKDLVRIETLERPNRATLIAAINEFQPHVLHFMGHGKFEELKGGAIALVDPEDNEAIWLSETEIDALFQQWQPQVVVLVACEGAKESVQAKVASLAQAIVSKNIEVVGMRFELKNQVAMKFTRAFYQALADGDPLDVATQVARAALYGADTSKTTRDFGGIVLYMRSSQGIIVPSAAKKHRDDRRPIPPPPTLSIQDAIAAYKRQIDLEWRGGINAAGQAEVDAKGKPYGKWIELETHPDFNNGEQRPE